MRNPEKKPSLNIEGQQKKMGKKSDAHTQILFGKCMITFFE